MLLDGEPGFFSLSFVCVWRGVSRPENALKLHVAIIFRSGQIDAKYQAYNASDASSAIY